MDQRVVDRMIPLPVGSPAPDFVLIEPTGRRALMSEMMGWKGILLVFYPSDWGLVCHWQMVALRDMQSDLEEAGYTLMGVSFNDLVSHGLWAERLKLRFPLMSDRDLAVTKAYGVYDDNEESYNKGRPLRGLFMVSREMIITWSWVTENLWIEPDYDGLLRIARESSEPGPG